MPDFATQTGEMIAINENTEFPTYYSDRLYEAALNLLQVAHEEHGLTSMKPGGEWMGAYAFYLRKNDDETQPNHAGVTGFH